MNKAKLNKFARIYIYNEIVIYGSSVIRSLFHVNRYYLTFHYLNRHMSLRIVITAQIRKHDIVIRAKNTLFLRITIMHVKTLDSSRRMLQCMFYDSHEKMYFHCDVFSIKTGYTIIRCLNLNVKYVV